MGNISAWVAVALAFTWGFGCAPPASPPGEEPSNLPVADTASDYQVAPPLADMAAVLFGPGNSAQITAAYVNRSHAGTDFGGVDGRNVYSPVAGTIVTNTSLCGLVGVSSGGKHYFFAHMTGRTTKSLGQAVVVGERLGTVGAEIGNGCTATNPHLHMEVRTPPLLGLASPTADNSATNFDPMTQTYAWQADVTPPSVSISSPLANARWSRTASYTIRWTASDAGSVDDVSVDLISGSALTCVGAPSVRRIRAAGLGYVTSAVYQVNMPVGTYQVKVAVRDRAGNWGCTSRVVTIF
jgi:hypothetical protein